MTKTKTLHRSSDQRNEKETVSGFLLLFVSLEEIILKRVSKKRHINIDI